MRASVGSFLGGLEPPMLPGPHVAVQPRQPEPTRRPLLAHLPEYEHTAPNTVPNRLGFTIVTDNPITSPASSTTTSTRPPTANPDHRDEERMMLTPPRPVDIAAEFPELAGQERPALRLHPRRGRPGRGTARSAARCCGRPPSLG